MIPPQSWGKWVYAYMLESVGKQVSKTLKAMRNGKLILTKDLKSG
jgi:hypothetical protein